MTLAQLQSFAAKAPLLAGWSVTVEAYTASGQDMLVVHLASASGDTLSYACEASHSLTPADVLAEIAYLRSVLHLRGAT